MDRLVAAAYADARDARKREIRRHLKNDAPVPYLAVFLCHYSARQTRHLTDLMTYGTAVITEAEREQICKWALRYAMRLKGEKL